MLPGGLRQGGAKARARAVARESASGRAEAQSAAQLRLQQLQHTCGFMPDTHAAAGQAWGGRLGEFRRLLE